MNTQLPEGVAVDANLARQLTSKARDAANPETLKATKAVVNLWEDAIRHAASRGFRMCCGDDLPKLRMHVPGIAYTLALKELKDRGFNVEGTGRSAFVSW